MPKPNTNIQWGAINKATKGNTLVSQLFAGKPVAQQPNVVASSSAVKNSNAPRSVPSLPYVPAPSISNTQNAASSAPLPAVPVSPQAPTNQPIKSHTVSASGDVTQTYHPPANTSTVSGATPQNNTSTSSPPITTTTPPTGTANGTLPPQAPRATFGGIVGNLADTSQQGSQAARDYTAQTAATGQGSIPIGQSAADIAKSYGQQIADVGTQTTNQGIGEASTGTSPVGEGNARLTATYGAAKQTALATAEDAALKGTGQQLTAQGQASNALNSAAGQAVAQQGQVQSGLSSAGTLAQPSANFPFVFDPTTGNFKTSGGGNFDPQTVAQQLAIGVMNKTIPYADAVSTLSYLPNGIGQTYLIQAIQAAGGDLTQIQAQGGIKTEQEQTLQGYKSALQQGQNLQSQLSDLITSFNLNPNDVNAVNTGVQRIAANTSNPYYKILNNYVADVASRYAQILTPSHGTNTDETRAVATGMIDSLAKGTSILTVMKALDDQAQAVIAGVPTIGSSGSSTGNKYTSKSGNSYNLPY